MDVKEAGQKGGIATKKRYGKKHYSEIGRIGGKQKKSLNTIHVKNTKQAVG